MERKILVAHVNEHDERYPIVCKLVREVYLQHLNLEPVHYPVNFIALFSEDDEPLGGAGYHLASTNKALLVDALMAPYAQAKQNYLTTHGVTGRNWAEITNFHIKPGYTALIPLALGATFLFLDQRYHIPITFNILTRLLRRFLHQLGIRIDDLCPVNPDLITGVSDNFLHAFIANYMARERRPTCVGIDVKQASQAFQCFIQTMQNIDQVCFASEFVVHPSFSGAKRLVAA